MPKPLKIVIPMAGYGTRLRPLTWSKPKPLIPLAGGTVLDHLLNMFRTVPDFDSAEFVFILGSTMGDQIQDHMAEHYPDWHVDYAIQPEMKGQSDAFWQARQFLHGSMLMAFSDTLIENDFSFLQGETLDGVAWVKPVPDPRRFGVAVVNDRGEVTRLIEKPQDITKNLVVVGCYYFKEAEDLVTAIEEQVRRNVNLRGEFYLADAINILLEQGKQMRTEKVETWLDAGTLQAILETNQYLLENGRENTKSLPELDQCDIHPPVFIHPTARVSQSSIGPHVSIGAGAVVNGSSLKNAVLAPNCQVNASTLADSILGQNVTVSEFSGKLFLGDDSVVNQ